MTEFEYMGNNGYLVEKIPKIELTDDNKIILENHQESDIIIIDLERKSFTVQIVGGA